MANIDTLRYKGIDYTLGKVPDKTLSISDTPADAKAVGDALANQLTAYPNISTSGSIAHFEDGADSIPMKDVLVHIEPVQEGSGDPSPDNVRAISGWTGAKVTRTGKNLFPKSSQNSTKNGITIETVSDGVYHIYGTATAGATFNIGNYVFPRERLELSGVTSDSNAQIYLNFKLNGTYVNRQVTVTKAKPTVRYTPEYDGYDSFDCGIFVSSGRTVDEYISPMLRLASDTDATFEPYAGDTYNITFPSSAGTVYSGTLDVTSGVLTVDRVSVDIGERSIVTFSNGFSFASPSAIRKAAGKTGILCDIYKPVTKGTASLVDYEITGGNVDASLYFKDSRFATPEEAKAGLSGHYVCYPLETPQTYQLAPQEITSLLGENNVWADTGDSDVQYRADTKMYVDNKIAELQALVLENNGGN